MENKSICKMRQISKIKTETPLLVPSFSSIVDSKIGEIYANLKDLIPDASLVSAYDIDKRYLDKNDVWASSVVFIDSGNYEIEKIMKLIRAEFDVVIRSIRKIEWSARDYTTLLDELVSLSNVVLVNFDVRKPIQIQVSEAESLFSRYPNYAKCFLYRPYSEKSYQIDVPKLIENIDLLKSFDILGLTEKELGSSLIKRCENLLKIRQEMISKELDLPIHVFGCLDPLGILVFFLCGADIFDGTNWLKFSFHNKIAMYTNNYSILTGCWADSDVSVRKSTYIFNLRELTHLMYEMRRYTQKHDLGVFSLTDDILKQVKDIISSAEVKCR